MFYIEKVPSPQFNIICYMRSHTYSTFFTVLLSVPSKSLFLLGKNKRAKVFYNQTLRGRSYPQLVHRLIHKRVMHRLIHRRLIHSVIHTVIHSREHSSTQCIHSLHIAYTQPIHSVHRLSIHSVHSVIHGHTHRYTPLHTVTNTEKHGPTR